MSATDATTWEIAGRTCMVTGANAGIGRETALELARRGARLVLACRSEDKTRPVIEQIREQTGAEVDFLQLDLTRLAAVRHAAEQWLARGQPLHVLIDNAGLAGQRGETADGFELQFGVNHMGHFLLTTMLLDRLTASAPARIVVVASHAHYRAQQLDFDEVRRPTRTLVGMNEYGVSKLANVLFAAELARRLDGTGVTTYSLHPGVVASNVWRRVPWPARSIMKAFMKSTEEGAKTTVWCATEPALAAETGRYYFECAPKRPSRLAHDTALAAELWRRSERWCDELARS